MRPRFQDEDGNFIGLERYQDILRANRLTVTDFEASIREDVLLDKLNTILAQTSFVSDAEVEKSYRDEAERAEIRYVQLPASEFAAAVAATAADVEAYFAEHRDDYELPEQRVVDYMLVDTVQLRRDPERLKRVLEARIDE